ncbi:Hypothetical protein TON_0302 [Thermococcus onnurineus NA1]|uniref:Oxidoreductase molybdopterin-binding domain-containing protein n=1 Tax=Thermococcus onnurineus (strain NA1) TaxID=523850 RepID=B6YTA0_THEON|nr:hypothetical protein [Thermococcus onnurineus]ACJ15787.1 Hypothetical protein TON_0302 [Thermococcus onnurineus NA1]
MKRAVLAIIILLTFSLGCISQGNTRETTTPALVSLNVSTEDYSNWTVYVTNGENVTEYTLDELKGMPMEEMLDKDLSIGKTLVWKGVPPQKLGKGDVINFVSDDLYLVSIPYYTKMILALYVDGNPLQGNDAPIKLIVDLSYGCRCNWIKKIRVVEFVRKSECFSVYGEVFNILYFSPRTLNIFRGIDSIVKNESNSARLKDVLDKAILKETAKKVVFVTGEGRFEYSLEEVLEKDPTIVYEDGEFKIPELGINDLKGINIEK